MPLGEFRPKSSFSLPFSYNNMQCFRGSNILNLPQSIFWNKAMVFCTKDDELKVKSRLEWGFRDLFSMTSLGCEQILQYPHIQPALDHFLAIRPDSHLTISLFVWYSPLKNWNLCHSYFFWIFVYWNLQLFHTWCQLSKVCPILAVRINIWFF